MFLGIPTVSRSFFLALFLLACSNQGLVRPNNRAAGVSLVGVVGVLGDPVI